MVTIMDSVKNNNAITIDIIDKNSPDYNPKAILSEKYKTLTINDMLGIGKKGDCPSIK